MIEENDGDSATVREFFPFFLIFSYFFIFSILAIPPIPSIPVLFYVYPKVIPLLFLSSSSFRKLLENYQTSNFLHCSSRSP